MVEQTDFQLHYNAPGRPLWSNFQGTATRHFLNTKIARKHTIQALPFLKKTVVPPFFLCANWCEFLVEETTYSLVLGSHGGTVSRQFMYTKIRLQTRSFFSKTSCHPFLLRELCHFFCGGDCAFARSWAHGFFGNYLTPQGCSRLQWVFLSSSEKLCKSTWGLVEVRKAGRRRK